MPILGGHSTACPRSQRSGPDPTPTKATWPTAGSSTRQRHHLASSEMSRGNRKLSSSGRPARTVCAPRGRCADPPSGPPDEGCAARRADPRAADPRLGLEGSVRKQAHREPPPVEAELDPCLTVDGELCARRGAGGCGLGRHRFCRWLRDRQHDDYRHGRRGQRRAGRGKHSPGGPNRPAAATSSCSALEFGSLLLHPGSDAPRGRGSRACARPPQSSAGPWRSPGSRARR